MTVTWDALRASRLGERRTATWDALPAGYDARRRDLRESLEAYAHRIGQSVRAARAGWRSESLRLLNVTPSCTPDHYSGLCAIAPGVAVPTAHVEWPDAWDGAS